MSSKPQIIFEDKDLLVLFKPQRLYVHPPERKHIALRVGRNTCIHWLEDHLGFRAYPVHRLDFATEGLIIFGKDRDTTALLNQQMREGGIKKFYDVLVRGWFPEDQGEINIALEIETSPEPLESITRYRTYRKLELPVSVNSSFPTTRYAWLDIELITGRWRQIRRHMNRVAHPVIGDREHGDSHHNRFFRDELGIDGLCLKAKRLEFTHPYTQEKHVFESPVSELWQKIEKLFN